MLSEGVWREDPEFADLLARQAVYTGPDNQMLIVGMGQKHGLWLNWGTEFKESVRNTPPGPHTTMALCQIRVDDFVAKLNRDQRFLVFEAPADISLVDPKYPPLAESQAFMDALAAVGEGLIEWRSDLTWRIEAKQGVITAVMMTSPEASYPIDAYLSDLLFERGKISDFSTRGSAYFLDLLKFRIRLKDPRPSS